MVLVVFEIANRVFFIVFVNAHLDILSLHIPDEPNKSLQAVKNTLYDLMTALG